MIGNRLKAVSAYCLLCWAGTSVNGFVPNLGADLKPSFQSTTTTTTGQTFNNNIKKNNPFQLQSSLKNDNENSIKKKEEKWYKMMETSTKKITATAATGLVALSLVLGDVFIDSPPPADAIMPESLPQMTTITTNALQQQQEMPSSFTSQVIAARSGGRSGGRASRGGISRSSYRSSGGPSRTSYRRSSTTVISPVIQPTVGFGSPFFFNPFYSPIGGYGYGYVSPFPSFGTLLFLGFMWFVLSTILSQRRRDDDYY